VLLASLDGALERILTGQELRCDIWANLDWVYLPSDNLKQVTDGFEFRDRLLVFSGTGVGYPSRRTRGAALAGVRLRQHAHQRPTLVLLASEGKPEEHKNGSIRKTTVDASKPEAFLTGVEVAKPTGNFVFPSERLRGSKPLDPASVLRKKIQPAFRRIGITVWAGTPFGTRWNHAGGDGRTSAHNPRLLAAQQPSSHEQVLAGNIEDQRLAQDKLVDSILPTGILPKTNLIQ